MRILSTLCCLLFSASLMASANFNRLIIFGDSLSDNGNLYEYMKHQLPNSPPYFEGRFTNGYTWVEQLAKKFSPDAPSSFLLDYAFGGATVYEGDDEESGLFDLKSEVSTYLYSHNHRADPNSLYVVWIGANNYLSMPDDADGATTEVTEGIRHQIQRLMDNGARKFLVINLPDMGATPLAVSIGEVERFHNYTRKHNDRLQAIVHDFKKDNPDGTWYLYDIETMLNEAIAEPEMYGLSNVTDTCYQAVVHEDQAPSLMQMTRSVMPYTKLAGCEGYLFFDPIHPTQIAHTILAQKIYNLLAPVGEETV